MKNYHISVVCSDGTTISYQISFNTRKEANAFCLGIQAMLTSEGKSIYLTTVKPIK